MPKIRFVAAKEAEKLDQAGLEQEYQSGEIFGNVRLGSSLVFWHSLLHTNYLPLDRAVWAYLRQEDSSATVCCGRTTFSNYFLLLQTDAGNGYKMPLPSLEIGNRLLEEMRSRNPNIVQGYSQEKAKQFGAAAG